jgi:PIN domain nuclease of toxin-antitoxin system
MAPHYLIDSHIFFWAIDAPENLSAAEREILDDSRVDVAVSVASFWELSIKLAKGMLRLGPGKAAIGSDYFGRQAGIAGFSALSIDPPEAEYVRVLPQIHRDPFDRIIIAQAMLSGRTIMTRDAVFARYPGVQVFTP